MPWCSPRSSDSSPGAGGCRANPEHETRFNYPRGMTDPTKLVSERVDRLLTELDPGSASQEEFRGRQYDLGLAWVHFPEGYGGLGLAPIHQRDIDDRLY